MVTFLPSYTDQNRLHQVEGKTLEKVEATNNTRMADSAHMESTSVEKREILRKFQIAKKDTTGPFRLHCN